jgi:hypothetical protein
VLPVVAFILGRIGAPITVIVAITTIGISFIFTNYRKIFEE